MRPVLVVIPARGGSTGILRKNLQTIDGRPLVARAVDIAAAAVSWLAVEARIVVTTDDPQIRQVASLAGAEIWDRHAGAGEQAPVWEPVAEVVARYDWWDPVVTFQPTCVIGDPAEFVAFLREAAALNAGDGLVAVTEDKALRWCGDRPLYAERTNRQWAVDATAVEVGLFACGTWDSTLPAPHLGASPTPVRVHAVDVDTPDDLAAARRMTARRVPTVVYAGTVPGGGSGHVHRQLALCDALSGHGYGPIIWSDVFMGGDAAALVAARGYELGDPHGQRLVLVDTPADTGAWADIRRANPDAVVAAFETDSAYADVTVNELDWTASGLAGPEYAILRPEIIAATAAAARPAPADWKVAVSFGGDDPAGMTGVAVEALAGYDLTVIPPPGWSADPHAVNVAEILAGSDLLITAAGRTVLEASAIGVPVVSVPANLREQARPVWPHVITLGLATTTVDVLAAVTARVLGDHRLRREMQTKGRALVDKRGTSRVINVLDDLLGFPH